MTYIGVQSVIELMSHFFFIFMTFWAMKGLRTDVWLKKNHIPQGRILYLFISIAMGYTVSNFFIDLILSSQNLLYLFG
ncbi:DUF1146 family protein [Atopococcus tabaci]|uniref:DUF1146 family protein n=2 Tax=Atopococcus tabaci TaxID=269774 RepID=UPI000405F30C